MHATPSHPTLLDVAIGAVVVDVVFLHLNYRRIVFVSDELTRWYTELGVSAMAADILVITLATYAGVLWSVTADGRFRLMPAMARVVVVQLVHDALFAYAFRKAPRGNYILDIFKDYADEVHVHALWSDSLMVLGAVAVAHATSGLRDDAKGAALLASLYAGLFALHQKRPTPPP